MLTFWKVFTAGIFVAIFLFGGYKLATDNQVNTNLKELLVDEMVNHPMSTSLFVKTLDELTPTFGYKIPFIDKKIFMINEFPFYGYTHTLITLLLLSIVSFLIRKMPKLQQIGIYLIVIILGYYIGSFVLLFIYNLCSSNLGYSMVEATQFRAQYSNNFDSFLLPLGLISFFSFLMIFKTVFKKIRKK